MVRRHGGGALVLLWPIDRLVGHTDTVRSHNENPPFESTSHLCRGERNPTDATSHYAHFRLRLHLEWADFGVSCPAPSADALSATLYKHSIWRLLSRAER
jgi:hypothetical protein